MNTSSDPSKNVTGSLFIKAITGVASLVLLAMGLMFSLAFFLVLAFLAVVFWAFLLWKTRILRREIRRQAVDSDSGPAFRDGMQESRVIEGESVRIDDTGSR